MDTDNIMMNASGGGPVVSFGTGFFYSNVNNFHAEEKLLRLIYNKKFDKAIEFLNDDQLTPQNITAAVNNKGGYNTTALIAAANRGAPLTLIQQLCEIGGRPRPGSPFCTAYHI